MRRKASRKRARMRPPPSAPLYSVVIQSSVTKGTTGAPSRSDSRVTLRSRLSEPREEKMTCGAYASISSIAGPERMEGREYAASRMGCATRTTAGTAASRISARRGRECARAAATAAPGSGGATDRSPCGVMAQKRRHTSNSGASGVTNGTYTCASRSCGHPWKRLVMVSELLWRRVKGFAVTTSTRGYASSLIPPPPGASGTRSA
jgi:hypothetical protein